MPDLAVYNLTSLTGLLGPAKHVSAMTSIITPERTVNDKGRITVAEDDNAMLLIDHGNGVISHVQSGFNYFNPHGHDGSRETRHTISIVGSHGYIGLVGYDWVPLGVDLATKDEPHLVRQATDAQGYIWQQGAALAAKCLATGQELLATPEHALHVLEIITAARQSQQRGQRIALTSTFKYPSRMSVSVRHCRVPQLVERKTSRKSTLARLPRNPGGRSCKITGGQGVLLDRGRHPK